MNAGGGRRAVLNIPGVGYRRYASLPRRRGKDTWRRAWPKARRQAERQLDNGIANALRRGFG